MYVYMDGQLSSMATVINPYNIHLALHAHGRSDGKSIVS